MDTKTVGGHILPPAQETPGSEDRYRLFGCLAARHDKAIWHACPCPPPHCAPRA